MAYYLNNTHAQVRHQDEYLKLYVNAWSHADAHARARVDARSGPDMDAHAELTQW